MMIVPILVVALEWRQAKIVTDDWNLLVWLMVYFGTMFVFSFLRLTRVPILQYSRGYFIYVIVTATVYYLALFSIFVWGNIMFWSQLTDDSRLDYNWQKESLYDHRILWIIMSVILTLNWVAILLCLHFIFFFSTLYVFWNTISKMVMKIAQDLSPRALMESMVEVLGEGEIQDSLVIGFLQYFMSSNNYYCRICKKPFTVTSETLRLTEQPSDSERSESASSINTNRLEPSEDVVQIGCNKSHYFHAGCLVATNQCPVCHD